MTMALRTRNLGSENYDERKDGQRSSLAAMRVRRSYKLPQLVASRQYPALADPVEPNGQGRLLEPGVPGHRVAVRTRSSGRAPLDSRVTRP